MNDLNEMIKRGMKYFIEGVMVAIVAVSIPKQRLKMEEIILISMTAAATFCLMDVFVPSLATSVRSGAGAGIGFNLVGFPRGRM